MARLRYLKTLEQVKRAKETNPEFLNSTTRSVRAVYETHPALVAAVLPKPLEPVDRPEVHVVVSHIAMHITPEFTMEIGAGVFGVQATYDGVPGIYVLTMPMTTEAAVVGGRETYGEPKKIAEIDFQQEGDQVSASITRMGIPYIQVSGTLGSDGGKREFTNHAYCYKALPSCDPDKDFDGDPVLVRLEWRHQHDHFHPVEGEVTLNESPFDPVADLPCKRIISMEYEQGNTESNGRVLRSVPGSWLLPFLHQRYDDPLAEGVEIPL